MRMLRAALLGIAASVGSTLPAMADPCTVPAYLISAEGDLNRVAAAVKARRLDIAVVGTGSAILPGPEGARHAFPARLEAELSRRLPGIAIKVVTDVKPRRTAAEMVRDAQSLLVDAKPALVIWQTGTVDAMRGIDPDGFRTTLEEGIEAFQARGADVVLVNMQFSPRTESMIAATPYSDRMRWASQRTAVPLFDRLAAMRYWHEEGTFDLAAATRDPATAQGVHNCLGRLIANLVIEKAHLTDKSEAPQ